MMNLDEEIRSGLKAQAVWNLFSEYHPVAQESLFNRACEILTYDQFNFVSGDHLIARELPNIGCSVRRSGPGTGACGSVFYLEKYVGGIDYDSISIADLDYYGFKRTKLQTIITAYSLPQYFREHVQKKAKNVVVVDIFNEGRVTTIDFMNPHHIHMLFQTASDRIFVLPKRVT